MFHSGTFSWGILFSHPADYTPVCTTELGAVNKLAAEFAKRNVKPIALSCDPVESHRGWIDDIKAYSSQSGEWAYPIIADKQRELAVKFGMLDPDEKDKAGMPLTARCVSFNSKISLGTITKVCRSPRNEQN